MKQELSSPCPLPLRGSRWLCSLNSKLTEVYIPLRFLLCSKALNQLKRRQPPLLRSCQVDVCAHNAFIKACHIYFWCKREGDIAARKDWSVLFIFVYVTCACEFLHAGFCRKVPICTLCFAASGDHSRHSCLVTCEAWILVVQLTTLSKSRCDNCEQVAAVLAPVRDRSEDNRQCAPDMRRGQGDAVFLLSSTRFVLQLFQM